MRNKSFNIISCFFLSIFFFAQGIIAQNNISEKHIEVSLRMIGHQLLLSSGDSISRVLPIIKEKNHYKIQFENLFEFNPDSLVRTVARIVKNTNLGSHYIVEMEQCESGEMVYSFEVDNLEKSDIIPCLQRNLPKSCYNLLFTLVRGTEQTSAMTSNASDSSNGNFNNLNLVLISVVVLLALGLFFFWKHRNKSSNDTNLIALGEYYFDKRNTELIIEQQKIELTSKEADLLLLLYDSANTTVERGVILNRVWGDEGDYIGRTLDVFISKLRKKLEFDSKVKIVNIRGIGYKLIVDV